MAAEIKDTPDDDTRFDFGSNWRDFSRLVDTVRINAAVEHLSEALHLNDLRGLTFLDVGSGSGLFSLAAKHLGANVHSFDYDPRSVACTEDLRTRSSFGHSGWTVQQGSILDPIFLATLQKYDIVHAWGVLHHTGAMWLALEQSIGLVAPKGLLYVALYNDQGYKSRCWWLIKYTYGRLPAAFRPLFAHLVSFFVRCAKIARDVTHRRPPSTTQTRVNHRKRAMSATHDMFDWIGGFPYEYVSFPVLRDYLLLRGFTIEHARPATSLGCHEIVCRRTSNV